MTNCGGAATGVAEALGNFGGSGRTGWWATGRGGGGELELRGTAETPSGGGLGVFDELKEASGDEREAYSKPDAGRRHLRS